MKNPYMECPSFEHCSCNVCPLDPISDERNRLVGEEKCVAWKSTRLKIAKKYPNLLKYKGLTGREYGGYRLSGKDMG